MAQETAVEWLEQSIKNNVTAPIFERLKREGYFEQAKQMEKEQIINAFGNEQSHLQDDGSWRKIYAEQYYNETYNTQNK